MAPVFPIETPPVASVSEISDRLVQLVDTLPELVWSTRPDGFCDFYNQRWLDYTGLTRETLYGYGWQDVLHPRDQERVAAAWENAISIGDGYRVEYRLRRHDGTYRWFLALGLPVKDDHGNTVRWSGSCTDIHEQKREQERQRFLADIADRTRLLEDTAEIMTVTVRMLGDFLQTDRTSCNEIDSAHGIVTVLCDYSPDGTSITGQFRLSDYGAEMAQELLSGWVVAVDDTATHPLTQDRYKQAYAPLGVQAFLSVPLVKNGVLVASMSVSSWTPRTWTTEEADLLLAVASRTWLSVENARLQDELEAHRHRMADLLATVPGVVWEAWGNPDSSRQRINFISQYVETMLGYTTEEWRATPNFWLQIVHPDDREAAAQIARQKFEDGKPHINEFRWITRDGDVRWVAAHSIVVWDENGEPVGMRGVNFDITERKSAEQEVLLLNERLRRSMQETHHRVRNSLQLIAALLDQRPEDSVITHEQLRDIGGQVRALAAVHDLLTDQARRDSVATDISSRDFLLKLVRLVKESSGVERLLADVSDTRITAREATALALITNELLMNAIKYGGGDISVAFDVEGTSGRLTVMDNGPGFPVDFQPPEGTTGLGLVSHIASWDLQAESLRFDTQPQGGGRVALTIPLSLAAGLAHAA